MMLSDVRCQDLARSRSSFQRDEKEGKIVKVAFCWSDHEESTNPSCLLRRDGTGHLGIKDMQVCQEQERAS